MCGRFALTLAAGLFERELGAAPPKGYRPRYNIHPDSPIVVLGDAGNGRAAVRMLWGLLPPWSDDPSDPARQINARSETAFDKPMFRDAIRQHRCLVPASGFFEWQRAGRDERRPWYVRRRDGRPLLFAGIWRRSRLAGGKALATCAILTADAHPSIAGIHHRMPVMLDDDAAEAWIRRGEGDAPLPRTVPESIGEELIEAVPVSAKVNDPRCDEPFLVEPLPEEERAPAQGSLL